MIQDCAKLLVEAAEEVYGPGTDVVQVRPDYSGRGMYGDTTTALVLGKFIDLAVLAAVAGKNTADDPAAFEALCAGLQGLRTDQMGRGVVVY